MNHVLIVDDDVDSASSMRELVMGERFSVAVAHNLRDARKQIAMQTPNLLLLDLELPDGNGMELFSDPQVVDESKIVLVTGHASLDSSIEALRRGAMDYLVKPVRMRRLEEILEGFTVPGGSDGALVPMARGAADEDGRFGRLWGSSQPMQRVYEQIRRVAPTGVTVLITGESGTGKEVVAQTLHELSSRRSKPFLAVNCGAISPQLIESEIFGHEKGSFTGAERQHQGFFERAAGGTLFLDEVTEMPPQLQVKLLRVLETGCFMRVGSTQTLQAQVRIVAATNRVPLEAVAAGKLREDLLYRLNVFPIALPPLRERLSDVPMLAEHFLQQISQREGRSKQFSSAALRQLARYPWPGNVRELRNAVQRAYVMACGEVIDTEWLPQAQALDGAGPLALPAPQALQDVGVEPEQVHAAQPNVLKLPVGLSMAEAEQLLIEETLKQCQYQKERTAAVLGISLKTLYNRLKRYSSAEQRAS
ncbi:sigma-54 dependent transcriptional regulator [Comamonas sp. NLF-1-9]|uniref:sigma-54-dependent transcriptional regulator n=1 Tax=Comamonas sp. NLF-1-9 TaxID=2853163 RepID=UPI001C454D79|nr:sigma-54 dependent transcriptional regulator [Comamonas sp. NLF-1-9]QXL85285.1 sigma-54 dependent transcriptional regulator [Comamonas sp. NLF-1-9]